MPVYSSISGLKCSLEQIRTVVLRADSDLSHAVSGDSDQRLSPPPLNNLHF